MNIEMASQSQFMRDLVGVRNGRLVARAVVGKNHEGRAMWQCQCDCGGTKIVQANNLTRLSGTKSCGCLRREANAKKRLRDGVWNDGKSYAIGGGVRCYKTRHSWAKAAIRHYGNACERCSWSAARCDVHHRHQKAKGGLHTISNAIVLCPNCHRVEHDMAGSL
jgi:HNH endonuclease